MTDKSTGTTQVQLGELLSLVGLFTGVWIKSYLQEHKLLRNSCVIESPSQHG